MTVQSPVFEYRAASGEVRRAVVKEREALFVVYVPGGPAGLGPAGEPAPERVIPVFRPPAVVDESSGAWAIVGGAVVATLELGSLVSAISGDELLSSIGRKRRLEPHIKKAISTTRTMIQNAHSLRDKALSARSSLFAFPTVSERASEIAADREVRDRFEALGDDQKGKVLTEILADPVKHQTIATALARSPWPLRYGKADETIRAAREKSVRALQPIKSAAADAEVSGYEWAVMALPPICEALVGVAALERGQLFDYVDGDDAAPDFVLSSFSYSNPSEVVLLRRRRAEGHRDGLFVAPTA